MATRKLEVQIIGDSKSLERAFARSQKSAQEFKTGIAGSVAGVESSFRRIRTPTIFGAAVATAVAATVGPVKNLAGAASDLQEQISKNKQVFGASADAVLTWSTTTAKSIGIARTEALDATGTFGNLFTAIGIVGPQAADFSRRLVKLAADLASFNNASPTDTLDAIRSGLVGEAEPLRRFGVLLSETRVQQVAMAQTGKTVASTLTDQEKAAARVAIIFKDTAKAQGDFQRTSGGLANQQRILNAQWKDARAQLGQNLLPVMIKFTGVANKVAGSLTNMRSETLLFSASFRKQLADAFGVEFVRDALAKAGPALEAAMKDFESSLDPFHIQVPIQLTPKVVSTPALTDPAAFSKLPGIDTGTPLAKDLSTNISKVFDSAKKQVADAIRKGKAAVAKAASEAAAQRRSDAFAKTLGNLRLGVDKAELTAGLRDDLNALKAVKAGLLRQISAGVDVQSAQSDLYSVMSQIASKQADIRTAARRSREEAQAAAKEAEQARQFRAIGLDAEGNRPPPAVANLKKQLAQLSSRNDLASGQKALLKRIRKVLVDPIHKATPETRDAINSLFDTIRQTFDKGAKKLQGPLTKTTSLNTKAALANVTGLTRDQTKQIRANLSNFNSAGRALAGSQTGAVNVNVVSNVTMDGQTVARNVTKHQQKATRRNPPQKRGPNRRGGV